MESFWGLLFFVFRMGFFFLFGIIMLPAMGLVLVFWDPWMSLIED